MACMWPRHLQARIIRFYASLGGALVDNDGWPERRSGVIPSAPPLTPAELAVATAQDGWDAYDGVAIPAERWALVTQLLARLSALPPPAIEPGGDGCIHLRWRRPENVVWDAEVDEKGHFWWTEAGPRTTEVAPMPTLAALADMVTVAFSRKAA
jgi:hypothetical protein